jgi:serine protease Do
MLKRTTYAILLVLAGFTAGLVLTGRLRSASDGLAMPALSAGQTGARSGGGSPGTLQPGSVAATLPDFSSIASRAVAGIVNISAVSVVQRPNSPFGNDPFFRQFFGEPDDWFGSRLEESSDLGSGVIISPDGYVVTNNHVVAGNVREITAGVTDKREFKGRIVGRDPMTDIAVIKINAQGLPVLPWADSSKVKVGQWALAIGSPFALNQTVTLGIVSAIGRTGMGMTAYEDFIQTDAAINPGNSGGGLLDSRGEVIGINTAIMSDGGGSNGVGFAVSSNLARRIADELIRYGEVRRGFIGPLDYRTMTPDFADQLGLTDTRGAVVLRMSRNSVAFQSGIQPGDVIVAFNGTKVENAETLTRLLADAAIGSTATVDVIRQGRKLTLKVPITGRSGRSR